MREEAELAKGAQEGGGGAKGGADDEGRLLLSLLGRIHAQMGHLAAAEDAFSRLECRVAEADAASDVLLNRGHLCVMHGDYEGALSEYTAALAADPADAVAANNRAVCLLYCCRLAEAIEALEAFVRGDPVARLVRPRPRPRSPARPWRRRRRAR